MLLRLLENFLDKYVLYKWNHVNKDFVMFLAVPAGKPMKFDPHKIDFHDIRFKTSSKI